MAKTKLGNPAIIATAIASTPQGQKAIGSAIDRVSGASSSALTIVKNVVWIGLAVGVGHYAYKKFINRFTKIGQNNQYEPAKINDAIASAKAESMYQAMKGFGNGFKSVKGNLTGLTHNDYIKVYNAFGNRQGAIPFSQEMNLNEWILDEFKGDELAQLKFIRPHFF
jgi:hypothetical protein